MKIEIKAVASGSSLNDIDLDTATAIFERHKSAIDVEAMTGYGRKRRTALEKYLETCPQKTTK